MSQRRVDTKAVSGEHDESTADDRNGERPRLRAVCGPIDGPPRRPRVQLVREWKGLTVADLSRAELVERLPGSVQSMLERIERGDFAGAERAFPGSAATVLVGPGHRRYERRWRLTLLVAAAVATGAVLASWLAT